MLATCSAVTIFPVFDNGPKPEALYNHPLVGTGGCLATPARGRPHPVQLCAGGAAGRLRAAGGHTRSQCSPGLQGSVRCCLGWSAGCGCDSRNCHPRCRFPLDSWAINLQRRFARVARVCDSTSGRARGGWVKGGGTRAWRLGIARARGAGELARARSDWGPAALRRATSCAPRCTGSRAARGWARRRRRSARIGSAGARPASGAALRRAPRHGQKAGKTGGVPSRPPRKRKARLR